jgi:hypothetical protein
MSSLKTVNSTGISASVISPDNETEPDIIHHSVNVGIPLDPERGNRNIKDQHRVLTCVEVPLDDLRKLLSRYGLKVIKVSDNDRLPGSYWGDPEAGLIGNSLYVRPATPVQSALHEACHYICMDASRRAQLHTDAGGGYDEENSVCYLQIILAQFLPGMGRSRMLRDMDRWGYSFRLGSASAWFEQDADDARHWLLHHNLINLNDQPTWRVRL